MCSPWTQQHPPCTHGMPSSCHGSAVSKGARHTPVPLHHSHVKFVTNHPHFLNSTSSSNRWMNSPSLHPVLSQSILRQFQHGLSLSRSFESLPHHLPQLLPLLLPSHCFTSKMIQIYHLAAFHHDQGTTNNRQNSILLHDLATDGV